MQKKSNRFRLNEFHQLPRWKRPAKPQSKQLRDKARLLEHLQRGGVALSEESRGVVERAATAKAAHRKAARVTDRYKKFRFYEMKRVAKELQRAEQSADEAQLAALQRKMVYLKVS